MKTDIKKWLKEEGEILLRKTGIKAGQIVLDFGCGSGNYTIPAAKIVGRQGKVYALDKSKGVLDKLMQKAKSLGLKNMKRVNTSEKLKIPLMDESVDVILLYDVLHGYYFSAKERNQLLEEVYRILKLKGFVSVYPEHMELGKLKEEIERAGFYLENQYPGVFLIHDNEFKKGIIFNFKKRK